MAKGEFGIRRLVARRPLDPAARLVLAPPREPPWPATAGFAALEARVALGPRLLGAHAALVRGGRLAVAACSRPGHAVAGRPACRSRWVLSGGVGGRDRSAGHAREADVAPEAAAPCGDGRRRGAARPARASAPARRSARAGRSSGRRLGRRPGRRSRAVVRPPWCRCCRQISIEDGSAGAAASVGASGCTSAGPLRRRGLGRGRALPSGWRGLDRFGRQVLGTGSAAAGLGRHRAATGLGRCRAAVSADSAAAAASGVAPRPATHRFQRAAARRSPAKSAAAVRPAQVPASRPACPRRARQCGLRLDGRSRLRRRQAEPAPAQVSA